MDHPASHSRGRPARQSTMLSLGLLILLSPGAARAGSAVPLSVTDNWAYRWGDPPAGPEGPNAWLNESLQAGWLTFPALKPPPGSDPNGILWIRVPLPSADWRDPAFFTGSFSGATEVYSQGQRIFASGEIRPGGHESTSFALWNLVSLDPSALGHPLFFRIQMTYGASADCHGPFVWGPVRTSSPRSSGGASSPSSSEYCR